MTLGNTIGCPPAAPEGVSEEQVAAGRALPPALPELSRGLHRGESHRSHLATTPRATPGHHGDCELIRCANEERCTTTQSSTFRSVSGVATADPGMMRAAHVGMELNVRSVIVPLAIATLISRRR